VNAENFREADAIRREKLTQRYPESWQDLCREILGLYAKHASRKPSRNPIGAPTLRNTIMEDEDKIDASGLDGRLSADHFSSWMRKKTKRLSDVEFSFVDKFIHTLPLIEEVYRPIKNDLYLHASDTMRRSFAKIYSSRKIYSESKIPDELKYLDQSTFICGALSGWEWNTPISGVTRTLDFNQIALYIHDYRYGMFAVKAIYSKNPFWKLRDKSLNPSDTVEYHGFLVFQLGVEPGYFSGVLHLTKKGVDGIHATGPFTASTFRISEEEDEYEFVTDWMPQIILPTVRLFLYDAPKYKIPDLRLIPPIKDEAEAWYISRGQLIFSKLNDEFEFVSDYLKGLTNEYVIW
jgi:hypothetical protein